MQFREYITRNIDASLKGEKEVALLFSGGTDSTCLLFSLLDLGIKPTLYIYTVEGYASDDYKKALMVRDKFGLELINGVIPNDIDLLMEDVKTLIHLGIKGQINIHCMHGNIYLQDKVKEKIAFNGSGVDGLYGTDKDMAIVKKNPIAFRKKQLEHLNNPNDDGMMYLFNFYKSAGIRVEYPYRKPNITDALLSCSHDEMNRPRNKWIVVKEYQDYYKQLKGYYNSRGSQQLQAGTKILHQKLLNSPLNTENRKSTIWIYKDIKKRMEDEK